MYGNFNVTSLVDVQKWYHIQYSKRKKKEKPEQFVQISRHSWPGLKADKDAVRAGLLDETLKYKKSLLTFRS